MLAAVYHGRHDVRVEEWPAPPPPPPGWVTVAVSWCGICGTDLEEFLHGPNLVPTDPHPLTGRSLPLVLGHEGTGRVVATGPGTRLPVGARVGLENSIGCGSCHHCDAGVPHLCDRGGATIGLMADGALAERVSVPERMCAPLPDGLSEEAGAIAEPLSVAIRAVRRAGPLDGRHVAVFGGGTIGLFVAQVARAARARAVALYEPSARRRQVASELGLAAAHPGEARPCPVVFECAGSPEALEAALSMTARRGTTLVVGIHPGRVPVDFTGLVMGEKTVVTSLAHALDPDYLEAIRMLERDDIVYESLVSARIHLSQVVGLGLEALASDRDGNLKILVDCSGS